MELSDELPSPFHFYASDIAVRDGHWFATLFPEAFSCADQLSIESQTLTGSLSLNFLDPRRLSVRFNGRSSEILTGALIDSVLIHPLRVDELTLQIPTWVRFLIQVRRENAVRTLQLSVIEHAGGGRERIVPILQAAERKL